MKFLIVDDDPICRELLEETLRPFGQCDTVVDGDEAIDMFRMALDDNQPYRLVCLDIMMPGLDGHKVLQSLRNLEHQRGVQRDESTRIIMTTALCESEHWLQAFDEGCQCYVTKPFDSDELISQLHHLGVLTESIP